ncbi:hypothetical protein HDV00_010125 [Rhizophlyctis rosea]|nr:hypothetical protein HDV00_010125 [Rhizophlyctis rosea]
MNGGDGSSDSQMQMQGRSRQYQTAMKLKSAVGGNRVWACDRCYRQKVKCDSARPSCTPCKRKNTPCTYGIRDTSAGGAGGRKGRRYDTAGYIRMLEARLREVEDMVSGSGGSKKDGAGGQGSAQGAPMAPSSAQGSGMADRRDLPNGGGYPPMGHAGYGYPPQHGYPGVPAPMVAPGYAPVSLPPPIPPSSSSMHPEYYGHEAYRPPPPPMHMMQGPPPLQVPSYHDRPPLPPPPAHPHQPAYHNSYPPHPYQHQQPLPPPPTSSQHMVGPYDPTRSPNNGEPYDSLPPPPPSLPITHGTHLPPPTPSYLPLSRSSFSRPSPPPPPSLYPPPSLHTTYPPQTLSTSRSYSPPPNARSESRRDSYRSDQRSTRKPLDIITSIHKKDLALASPPLSPTTASLFSLSTLTPLAQLFFTLKYSTFFLLPIHPPTFLNSIQQQPPFLLYSMAAAVVDNVWEEVESLRVYCREKGIRRGEEGERLMDMYLTKARTLVADEVEKPTLEGAVALGCLGTAASLLGEAALAHSFASMSVRMATDLRLNIDPDIEEVHGSLTWLQKEARRRAWWTACVLDALDSAPTMPSSPTILASDLPRFDRIPFVHDRDNTTVKAPAPEHLWQSVTSIDGLPNVAAFAPGSDLDLAEFTGGLARVVGEQRRWRGKMGLSDETPAKSQSQSENDLSVSRRTSSSSVASNKSPSPTPPPRPFTLTTLPTHLAQLETHLHSLVQTLPPWARNVDNYTSFSHNTVVRDPPPWQLLVSHIVYHGVLVGLYLPAGVDVGGGLGTPQDIVKVVGDRIAATATSTAGPGSPPNTPPTRPPPLTIHPTALHHSHRISHLLRLALNADANLKHFSAWVLQFVFYSCVVLSVAVRSSAKAKVSGESKEEDGSTSGGVEMMTEEEREGCDRDLDTHLRFFDVFRGSVVGRRVRAVVEEVVGRM